MSTDTLTAVPDGYIDVDAAAEIIGCHSSTVHHLAQHGTIPAGTRVKINRSARLYWDRKTIEQYKAKKDVTPDKRTIPGFNRTRKAPDGFCREAEAAKILGVSRSQFQGLVAMQKAPSPRWYYPPENPSSSFLIWSIKELHEALKKAPEEVKKPVNLPLSVEALALLSRLRRYADAEGRVDGDASDIVLMGNPPSPKAWDNIEELAKARKLDWWMDNWDRVTFVIAPERKTDK